MRSSLRTLFAVLSLSATFQVDTAAAEYRGIVETPGGRRIAVAATAIAPQRLPEGQFLIAKFRGRIDGASRDALAAAGFREISYFPDDALLLERPASGGDIEIAALTGWIPYLPEDRLSRELTPESLQARRDASDIPIMIHIVPGESHEATVARLVALGLPVLGAGWTASSTAGGDGAWGRVVTLVPPESAALAAADLAALPEVFFVERIHHLGLLNDRSVGTMQSGVQGSAPAQTPIWNQGIRGEGQIVGEIDTGADADNCWFRDAARGLPPTNTWSAIGGYGTALDLAYRKIVAYDFLYSCDQYPAGGGCDTPSNPTRWDNQGHGTHVGGNMCGDNDANPITHDTADGIAPAAKFVPQDAGYGADACADLPGLGCPLIDTYPLFDQARRQGVRLHNNSYGDNENAPAPNQSNYTARAQDVDRFVWDYREFLVVHAAGNSGSGNTDFSVGSPTTNKNGLSIGSGRTSPTSTNDENMSSFSSRGWSGDGRIKPDLMAPGNNVSAGNNSNVTIPNCGTDSGGGTSYASPTAVGAAALARQYFTDGFYPSGARTAADGFAPSAALMKAALINSAVAMTGTDNSGGAISPIPSNEQGWGRIRLDKTLLFAPPVRRLYADDHRMAMGAGAVTAYVTTLSSVTNAEPLEVTLAWTDYPGTPDSPPAAPTIGNPLSWSAARLVNDLDLVVSGPSGTFRGNVFSGGASTTGGSADRRNNVEQVLIAAPSPGIYTVTVTPFNVVQAGQEFALLATGAWGSVADCNPGVPGAPSVTASTATSVTLDWVSGSPAGASYRLWRTSGSCVEGPWTLVASPAAPPYTDSGLAPATTYLYRLSAVSANGLCESRRSVCITGKCVSAPTFAGASSAVADAAAACGITITWPAASSACPGESLVYNLYRDTNPAFTPAPGNLLVPCLTGTSYHDTALLVSGVAVTYIVRAEDSRIAGSGACGGGATDANTTRVTAIPGGPPITLFSDGFEAGLANWTVTQWSADATQQRSGAFSAHSQNSDNTCATLTLATGVALPSGTAPVLRYSARWLIEQGYDGGVVEVAPGPAFSTWTLLTPTPAYPGVRNGVAGSCVAANTPCYTGSNSSWTDAAASLSAYAGQTVKIRFRYGSDVGQNLGGLWIDDVSISYASNCATIVAEVSAAGSSVPLEITKQGGSVVRATFQRMPGAQLYNVYEGTAAPGSYYSHAGAAGNLCGPAITDPGNGRLTLDFTPSAGANRYFLVTEAAGGVEGPSGYASSGTEIPAAASTCAP